MNVLDSLPLVVPGHLQVTTSSFISMGGGIDQFPLPTGYCLMNVEAAGCGMVAHGSQLVLFGGYDGDSHTNQ